MYIPVQSDRKEVRYERRKTSSPYAPASIWEASEYRSHSHVSEPTFGYDSLQGIKNRKVLVDYLAQFPVHERFLIFDIEF